MQRFSKWFSPAVGACVGALIIYVILKAATIPFTYDEAFSFSHFATSPACDVMRSAKAFAIANNHVLNTLLMKLMMCFGNQPFLLRVPNLLAYCLFIYSGYRIAQLWFSSRLLQVALLLCLALNPMLSEFFALARGYGLGIGMLMCSLLQLMLLTQDHYRRARTIHTHLCLFAALLAAYSSFSFLLPVLVILALVAAVRYLILSAESTTIRIGKAAFLPIVYAAVLVALVYQPLKYLIAANALYRGGFNNFFSDTWTSMISDLLGCRSADFNVMENGGPDPVWLIVLSALSLVLLLLSFVVTGKAFMRKRNARADWPCIIACLLLAGCIVGLNVLFYVQHTPFITFRVALYLYPLVILAVFAAIKVIAQRQDRTAKRIASVLCLALLVNFCSQLNITTTRDWRFDAFITRVCHYIVEGRQEQPAKLGAYHLMQPALEFYTNTAFKGTIMLQPYNDSALQCCPATYDYIYFPRVRADKLWKDFKVVQAYDDSTYLLFRRK